jgi:hypothetical protein
MKTTLWTQHQRHLHLFSIISAPCKVHFILVQTADCGSSLTNVEVCYRRTQNIAQISPVVLWHHTVHFIQASAQATPPSSSTERSCTLSLLFFYSVFSLSDIGLQFKCFAVCPSAHASVFTQFVNETTKLNTIMSLTILNYIDSFTNDEVLTTSAGLHEASNRHIA